MLARGVPMIVIYANRKIEAGEQILIDYTGAAAACQNIHQAVMSVSALQPRVSCSNYQVSEHISYNN